MLTYVLKIGLVSSVALTASLVWAGVANKGFHMAGNNLLILSGLPTALSLYFVCFVGHGIFPTVYSSMKSKKDFPKSKPSGVDLKKSITRSQVCASVKGGDRDEFGFYLIYTC
uniref:Amino acid transporter transmembrane domain-containing protein n=1 Tax=Oryza meridionalis TaxID=40149 RepID=A0A0E0DQJ9_9ORYZ